MSLLLAEVCLAMPKRKPQIRAYVDEHTDKLLKALAGVMDSNVNAIVVEAIASRYGVCVAGKPIEQWLSKPEIQEKIEKHRLDELD